jgi:hypothetical protein
MSSWSCVKIARKVTHVDVSPKIDLERSIGSKAMPFRRDRISFR